MEPYILILMNLLLLPAEVVLWAYQTAREYEKWYKIVDPCIVQGVISFFSWGVKIFFYSLMPPDYWKIGKNNILYVVIWRYS